MFQQVEETALFLTPFDLADSSLAPKIEGAGPIDVNSLADPLQARDTDPPFADFCAALDLSALAPVATLLSPLTDAANISLFDIYGQAQSHLESKEVAQAIALFGTLAHLVETAGPAHCALAACACQHHQFQHGYTFALESIAQREKHPRVHLIAGYCALQIGDKKHAKKHLALTTRLARSNPACRNELRSAQRELLLMQISS